MSSILVPTRRALLKATAASALAMPFVSRAWAAVTEINMLAWYGHGEPDVVGEFEAANNVKFKPKIMPVVTICLRSSRNHLLELMM